MKIGAKISLIYVVLCCGYILLSDRWVQAFVQAPERITVIQTYKGFCFVILSGVLIFYLVKKYFDRIEQVNSELRDTISYYRPVFEKIPLPVFIIGSEKFNFLQINDAARLRYGYSTDRHTTLVDQVVNFDREEFRRILSGIGEGYEELVFESYDNAGRLVYLQTFCQRIRYKGQRAIIMVCLDVTALKDSSAMVMDKMIDALENERMTFSTEIHDGIKQYFGLANGMIRTLKTQLSVSGRQEELLDRVENLTAVGIEECRRLSHAITPMVGSSEDLYGSLIHLVENLNYLDDILFHLDLQMLHVYSKEINLNVYRIVQEATRNIRQHSEAKNAWISLIEKNGALVLDIRDDGRGFNTTFVSKAVDSIGMTTMRTRAYKLGGYFNLRSELGKGTSLMVTIPLDRDAHKVA